MPHPRKTPRRFAITAAAGAVLAACAPATAAVSPQDAKALNDALDDEYLAEATYQAVLDKYPGARPFINIIEAERRHAERAKAEMDRLGINYEAENRHLGKIKAPASLLEACEQGVAAEIANIALYDRLLTHDNRQSGSRNTDGVAVGFARTPSTSLSALCCARRGDGARARPRPRPR